jgi:hypothetical protein
MPGLGIGSGTSFAEGTHSGRPAAATDNTGYYYWETDTYQLFQSDGSAWQPLAANGKYTRNVEFTNGGSTLVAAHQEIWIPTASQIVGITLLAPNESGSISVDVLTCTYSGAPTFASITASAPATLSSAQKSQPSVSTWTVAIAAGTFVKFAISSITSLTALLVALDLIAQ